MSDGDFILSVGIDPGVVPAAFFMLTGPDGDYTCSYSELELEAMGKVPHNVAIREYARLMEMTADNTVAYHEEHSGEEVPAGINVAVTIEDVFMQHRPGQSTSTAMKLQVAYMTVMAAAVLWQEWWSEGDVPMDRFTINTVRPQTWQAFYALRMRDQDTPIKDATRDMAAQVIRHKTAQVDDPEFDDSLILASLSDHNRADAALLANYGHCKRFDWPFWKPLAEGAH